MALLRCLNPNCSDGDEGDAPVFDFEADDGKCPKCAATVKDHPHTVVPRATIHYLVNDDKGAIRTPNGRRAVACDPGKAKLPKHATALREAVSCPKCQASEVYAAHVAGNVDQSRRIVQFDGDAARMAGGAFAGAVSSD